MSRKTIFFPLFILVLFFVSCNSPSSGNDGKVDSFTFDSNSHIITASIDVPNGTLITAKIGNIEKTEKVVNKTFSANLSDFFVYSVKGGNTYSVSLSGTGFDTINKNN